MEVVRFRDAPPYAAPGHHAMRLRRLQGREASQAERLWLGLSVVEPGGGTDMSASPVEKLYVVIEGELVVETPAGVCVLGRLDSVRIAPGEARALANRTDAPATVLLAMPERTAGPGSG